MFILQIVFGEILFLIYGILIGDVEEKYLVIYKLDSSSSKELTVSTINILVSLNAIVPTIQFDNKFVNVCRSET